MDINIVHIEKKVGKRMLRFIQNQINVSSYVFFTSIDTCYVDVQDSAPTVFIYFKCFFYSTLKANCTSLKEGSVTMC